MVNALVSLTILHQAYLNSARTASPKFYAAMTVHITDNGSTGSQSIERAVAVLRAIASAGQGGATVAAVATAIGLNRTTVHRIAAALSRERLIDRDEVSGRCYLGAEIAALGTLASLRHGVHQRAITALTRLSAHSGDTAFLSTPSGFDSVCLHREEGSFPIRTQVLWPGQRQPLGVGAGSLALLAAMPDETVTAALEVNRARLERDYPRFADDGLLRLVERAKRDGFAVNQGMIVPGSWAVGVAIRNSRGEPVAALSIAAIEARMSDDRRCEIASMLLAERDQLE
jgi:DNA-binding IclR family transcriptional regulator